LKKSVEIKGYTGRRIDVPAKWNDIFTHFYYAANTGTDTITQTLLPDMRSILLFSFGNPLLTDHQSVLDNVSISAPIKKALHYKMVPDTEMLVAHFKDDALFRFFGKSVPETPLFSNPDALIGAQCFSQLHEQLKELHEPETKINYLLNYASAFLLDRKEEAGTILKANSSLFNPVKVIAQKQGISERSVQLHYKKYYGYSAKELARYQRFEKVMEAINDLLAKNEKINWFDLIDAFGYYDQSHLIADFKYYIGLSPVNYTRLQQEFCKAT
jgi:AraC-like DNA-binding protein